MKDNKQRLFELMNKMDSNFKLNEDFNKFDEVKEVIKKQLEIADWNSKEGQAKRQQFARTVSDIYTQIEGYLKSSISNEDKAKQINGRLRGLTILSSIIGIAGVIFNTHFVGPNFGDIMNLDFGHVDIGGTFWLKLALFLFVLRCIHTVLSKGVSIARDFNSIWVFIKRLFSGNLLKEEPEGNNDFDLVKTLDSISFN